MKHSATHASTVLTLLLALVVGVGSLALTGCGGSSSSEGGTDGQAAQDGAQDIHLVYVNWVEGVAMAHVMSALMQDSLGLNVEMTQVNGGGAAFSSAATGDADLVVEAWLPTTHSGPWDRYKDQLSKASTWYENTTVGLVVPAYADINSVSDLAEVREQLDGEIIGIESGAAINEQTRQVLADNNIEGFNVTASSGPAMVAAMEKAIQNEEPIVITGWKPHWMWGRFDLKYLEGAQTGQSDVFGAPENIFMLAREGFAQDYSDRVTQFLENVSLDDEQLSNLMQPYRPESDQDKMDAAREWIQGHRDLVAGWMGQGGSAGGSSMDSTATASATAN